MKNFPAKVLWDQGEKSYLFDGSESDLYKQAASVMLEIPLPNTITVEALNGKTVVELKPRGKWRDEDGEEHVQVHVNVMQNGISPRRSLYKEALFTCIHPYSNNYKAYQIIPQNINGVTTGLDARYEDIQKFFSGQYKSVNGFYEPWLYWFLYYEKLSKGYKDQTKLFKKSAVKKKAPASGNAVATANELLYASLMAYAQNLVKKVTVVNQQNGSGFDITPRMVEEAWKIWNVMQTRKTVKGFNRQLCELMQICPRNRDWHDHNAVLAYLAKKKDDFPAIIAREEALIRAMDAVAGGNGSDTNDKAQQNAATESFKKYGIHVWEATQKQRDEVMSYLNPSLQSKVKRIYRVKPEQQEKNFARYCKQYHIREKKKLWHGSINSNWASIIKTSLSMQRGVANGRMFGDGIYFAPSAAKSFNYTSFRGTTWARGNDDTGFMGLYVTAYGNPMMVTSSGRYTQSQLQARGYNCVHAEAARTGLRADEIIFYDPDAVCLNYLVEFG